MHPARVLFNMWQNAGSNEKLFVLSNPPTPRIVDRKTNITPVDGDKVCVAAQKARQVLRAEIKNK